MYGADNVTFDPENKKFRIFAKKEMLALKTSSLKDWKVLGIEENMKSVLKKILPEALMADL